MYIFNFLFKDRRMSWVWLIIRLYVGWQWLSAGYEKVISAAWTGAGAGTAISGFLNGALAKTTGTHPDVSSWYAWFISHLVLPHATTWSYLIAYGELLVGIGLILGLLTFVATFFGFFMNLNYLLAGTVSTNPQLLVLALLIMLAHRIAGLIGLDHFILKHKK